MRTETILHLVMLAYVPVSVRAQHVDWLNAYQGSFVGVLLRPNGNGDVYGAGVFDGNVLIDGTPVENDGSDIFLTKWNSEGELQWARDVGGECPFGDLEGVRDLVYDALADELLVTGIYNTTMVFGEDTLLGYGPCQDQERWMYLARFTADGEFLWARNASGSIVDGSLALPSLSGEIDIFGACTYGAIFHASTDVEVPNGGYHARYSATGELLSAERIITNGAVRSAMMLENEEALLVGAFDASGVLLGTNVDVTGTSTNFLAKVDLTGEVDWLVPFRSSQSVYLSNAVRAGANKVIASGFFWNDLMMPWDTINTTSGASSGFLICFDLTGEFQWITLMSSSSGDAVNGRISTYGDGQVLVPGRFESQLNIGEVVLQASTSSEGFLAAVDTLGVCRSAWGFGKIVAMSAAASAGDGVYVACVYDSTLTFEEYSLPHPGGIDRYLMVAKLDSLSGFTGIPPTMTLNGSLTIYANPNNGLCTVELPSSLRPSADLQLSIYDNTGRLVQRAPLLFTEEGVRLDIRTQARGVYHVEVGDGRQRYSGRIVFE